MIGHSFPTLEKLPYIPTMHNKRLTHLRARAGPALALGSSPGHAWSRGQAPSAGTQPPAAQPLRRRPRAAPAGSPVPPAEPAPEPPTEAERLIDPAIKKVAGLKSVSADVTQKVEMLNQKFDVKGQLPQGPVTRGSI